MAYIEGALSALADPTRDIEVVEAAHPVSDEAGERAARRMLEMVAGLTPDDLARYEQAGMVHAHTTKDEAKATLVAGG